MTAPFAFDNSFARLPERFFQRLDPAPMPDAQLIRLNQPLARRLGLDPDLMQTPQGVAMLAGQSLPEGAEPLAMAYAGHQFGGWVPQLGDGRALLLGEVLDSQGTRLDIQLKGAGRTPFSRDGDGRAVLGPVLREYIISEAMAALGIPTTRALAAFTTGEQVMREALLPGAMLARVAQSHVRVGTFQFFAARGDSEALRLLADYMIARHYPDAANAPNPYQALLDEVVSRQAALTAQWMGIGFIHGVMNTDNMSIAGETIDYGPCAFIDSYHPDTVFSSIDQRGRYAYANQPPIAHWNLAQLATALLPLLGASPEAAVSEAQSIIDTFRDQYEAHWLAVMRRKLGLAQEHKDDAALSRDLLACMAENGADFTRTFRLLSDAEQAESHAATELRAQFDPPGAFDAWARRWRTRLGEETTDPTTRRANMRAANPAFIPRNHLVEQVIRAAEDNTDFAPFEDLLGVLAQPFADQPANARFAEPPQPDQIVQATFCGT